MEHQAVEYFSAYKTLNPLTEIKELQDLLKVLDNDQEFQALLIEIKDSQGLFNEFKSLQNSKKLEIMIRCYYQARTVRDQLFLICEEFNSDKEETIKQNEAAIREKSEKFKQDTQKLKLEIDVHKNELTSLRKTNEIYQAEISRLKHKYEKSKKEVEDEKKSNPKLEDLLVRREGENEQLHDDVTQLKVKIESITKQRDKFEISSREYWNRFQDLEGQKEQLVNSNKSFAEKIKKLEMFIKDKYPGQFESLSTTHKGVSLDALYLSVAESKDKENSKLTPERYLGYMNIHLKPTKILSSINKPKSTLQVINEINNENLKEKNIVKEISIDTKLDKNQIASVSRELKNFNEVSDYGTDMNAFESVMSDDSLINNIDDSDNEVVENKDGKSKDFSSQDFGVSNNTVDFNFNTQKSDLNFSSVAGDKKFQSNTLSHNSNNNTNNFVSAMENLTNYYNSGNDPI